MAWNNLFLIPIALIGGLVAFFFGRTIFGSIKQVFTRRAASVDMTPPLPSVVCPRPKALADRRELWQQEALSTDDQIDALATMLAEMDAEEERRKKLMEEARVRSKSKNVLTGRLDFDPKAGPMTTMIKLSEDFTEKLKAARDTNAAPKS